MKRILNLQSAVSTVLLKQVLAVFGLAAFALSGGLLEAASPDLSTTIPRGGQVGKEVKVTMMGARLSDAEEVIFHGEGITAKDLKVIDDKKVEVTFVIAPDCRLSEHHFRVRCRSGISFARNFWISQFPNVEEVEPNDDFAAPQKISMNVTIEAEAKPEETDYYQVSLKKGERLSVEIEGLRINNITQNIAIDPYVSILNKQKFEIASADGSALLKQESILSILVPEDGDYIVEVRDSAYQGRGRYRAHIGNFPRPTGIYPAGAKAGSEIEFTMLGDVKGTYPAKVKLPLEAEGGNFGVISSNGGFLVPSPNVVRLSPFENLLEVEPNNAGPEATVGAALPLAFNGIINQEGDIDFFKFTAKKDQAFQIRVYANSIGSPLDPVLTVYNEKMGGLGSSDDADGTKDGKVDFKAPADGSYFVSVKDMLARGGSDFVYRVEAVAPQATIEVTMPEMLRRELQYLKQFNVPQGGYFSMVVNTTRKAVAGDLKLEMPSLPAGVTLVPIVIPKSVSQFPILLKAAPDAPIAGGMYTLLAKVAEGENPVSGVFTQTLDLVRGPQNGVEYYSRYYSKLPVSVVEPLPYSVTIDQPKVPIVRNGMMKLKVRAVRKAGYDKKITVRFPWVPPGISTPATMTFNEKDTELLYELNANANAELNTWPLTLIAESDGGTGVAFSAAPYINLVVEEPFVDVKFSMTSAKQGETADMVGEVEQLRPFEGEAEVQLFGLPANSTAEVQKLKKELTGITFPVVTTDKTPVGQHKGVFCTVTVMQNGEPILHRLAMGSVVRVDPMPKVAVEAPKKVAVAAAAPVQKEKPLSRLEQLRLEAQKEGAAK
ncbi:MAG: PPC domain-containing protein [Verrucomicrobiales bacterium]|jgi:hypothetical protein|nr:PPC domain-containing protein [Verrucomicrobiales bacterium]MBP9223839.1 PPC domain-containing protein [Verrucomicrobiales bacterium]